MEPNASLHSVVLLIYKQCKEPNCSLVNVNRIIEFITPNFDLNSEEAVQLQICVLFQLLRNEGKDNNDLISEEQFEKVLKLWIPTVHNENGQSLSENNKDDDFLTGGVHNRLSRSLTNLKQLIDDDRENKKRFSHSWVFDNVSNDENSCCNWKQTIEEPSRSLSPHEDPFIIPINVIKSTPVKLSKRRKMGALQQQNLLFIRPQHQVDQTSFSDSDALYHCDGSYFEDDCTEYVDSNRDINKIETKRKKHRNSSTRQHDFDNTDTRDLLSQLKQIKFKNSQLEEINDRLQVQLEAAEDSLKGLTNKCWNLEKQKKLYSNLSEENKQFVFEIDDIRKSLEREIESKRVLLSEKIMSESELTVSKEHIQTLVDKLNVLDTAMEQKDYMIGSLKSMISQQQDFCSKLQELNLEKDDEIAKNEKTMGELTDVIDDYQEKIDMLIKEKDTLECNYLTLIKSDNLHRSLEKMESSEDSKREERGCSGGLEDDKPRLFTTTAQFTPYNSRSPWSIKVEMAKQLVDCRGDNPLCEKVPMIDYWTSNEDSDDSSYHMLREMLTVLSSLRMTLAQYKDHLETASVTIKSNEHYSDEITLSYISYLDDSISLLAASTEKASECQNKFNDTFELLMKRISTLKNENKMLFLKNEQLSLQVADSSNNLDISVAEKICFLEEELRRERLSVTKKQNEIHDLKAQTDEWNKNLRCFDCAKSLAKFSMSSEMIQRHLATEALNLEDQSTQQRNRDIHRSFSNAEQRTPYNLDDPWLRCDKTLSRKSSVSMDELHIRSAQGEDHKAMEDQDIEMIDGRNYYISTDNLSATPRYRLSRTQPTPFDIDQIIENSWLESHSAIEERRASVFVNDNVDINLPSPNESMPDIAQSQSVDKARARRSSSSCSSSNDTSDANSIDVNLERQKLAQELESRNLRLQCRSPVPSTLNVYDELKSITPTVNEEEQLKVYNLYSNQSAPDAYNGDPQSILDECSATESACMDFHPSSRRSSKQSVVANAGESTIVDSLNMDAIMPKQSLPTISIVEVSSCETFQADAMETHSLDENRPSSSMRIGTFDTGLELEGNTLQASMNKSGQSSRKSSIAGDDSKLFRRTKQNHKRIRRPFTVTGIGLTNTRLVQDDASSNYEDMSNVGDYCDIQESINLLQEMKKKLSSMSPEDLENKFNEVSLVYRTDSPTLVDRANHASKKSNKAMMNVEQEFGILRHLINNVAQIIDPPSEFVPRIKASISVLEKCVEYLSAKSEILGAIEQELKMSSIVDVMQMYSNSIVKQRDEQLRELDEAKSWRESNTDICSSGSQEQSRPKRSALAGKKVVSKSEHYERYSFQIPVKPAKSNINKNFQDLCRTLRVRSNSESDLLQKEVKDPKTRFQMLAQNTAMKSSIVRQFAATSFQRSGQTSSNNNSPLDSPPSEHKSPLRRTTSNKAIEFVDSLKKGLDSDNPKIRKYTTTKFFPSGGSVEESGESLFQMGLQQGLRLSTDKALSEMRADQSKFSSRLDSLGDLIEEFDSLENDGGDAEDTSMHTSLAAIRTRLGDLCSGARTFLRRSLLLAVGLVVVVALVIPWLLGPPPSTSPESPAPPPPPPSRSPSPSPSPIFQSLGVVRHRPAAV